MADKITITAPFSQDARSLGRIGRVGENISRQIVFDCTSVLTDHPNANIVCAIQRPGDKQPYAAQLTRVGSTGEFKLELTSTEVAVSGSVRFELRMVDGDEILKAAICTGTVEASMSGVGDTPGAPIADALNRLETAIAEVGNYADLNTTKQDKLIAGTGITIAEDGKTISASGGGGGSGKAPKLLGTLECTIPAETPLPYGAVFNMLPAWTFEEGVTHTANFPVIKDNVAYFTHLVKSNTAEFTVDFLSAGATYGLELFPASSSKSKTEQAATLKLYAWIVA